MPFPLIPALLAAGTAVAGHIGKKEQSKEAKRMASIQAKYSPWTGVSPDTRRAENPALMPDLLAGAGAALAMGQQADKRAQDEQQTNFWQKLMSKKYGMDQPTMQTNQSGQFAADPALAGIADAQGQGRYSIGGGWQGVR